LEGSPGRELGLLRFLVTTGEGLLAARDTTSIGWGGWEGAMADEDPHLERTARAGLDFEPEDLPGEVFGLLSPP